MARASQLFIPTLREDPGDAEAASHRLLVRGGFIRQVSAGLWSFLPLGWRVHEKAVQIVREEMNAIGGQEMFMPVVTPAELWEASGRYAIPELWKTEDRMGRPFVLAMTHEETVTYHAREISSYRQLPQILYHFQTKVRDEPRPRAGLIRVREFVMKDSYSFDRDEEGLEQSFRAHEGAYHRIFERCGLEYYAVQAESGMMGGSASVDFLAPSASGENTLVTCENGDYAADLEVARGVPRAPRVSRAPRRPCRGRDSGSHHHRRARGVSRHRRRRDLEGHAGGDPGRHARPRARARGRQARGGEDGGGPRRRVPARRPKTRSKRPSGPTRARSARSASPARSSRTRRSARDSSSSARTAPGGTCAGPSTVATTRRSSPTSASPEMETRARSAAGASASRRHSRSGTYSSSGRTTRSRWARGTSTRRGRSARSSWAATASAQGESWRPRWSSGTTSAGSRGRAPWRRTRSRSSPSARPAQRPWTIAERVAGDLESAGLQVLLDDRDLRPGEKFADADLLGCPVRVTIGKKTLEDGSADVLRRSDREEQRIAVESLIDHVKEVL